MQQPRALRRVLRAGSVDARADDAAGRACASTTPGATFPKQTVGPARFLPTAVTYPEDRGRDRLQRHHAARRAGLRPVRATARRRSRSTSAGTSRRRSNGLSYGACEPDRARLTTTASRAPGPTQRQLRPGLRSAEPGARRTRHRRRLLRRRSATLNFGKQRVHQHADDPELLSGWGVRAGRLADRRVGAAAGAAARVGRGRLLPALADTTSPWIDNRPAGADRLRHASASRRRRSAAAGRRRPRGLGPLQRQPERGLGRSTTSRRWRATTASSTRRTSHGILFNVSARPRNGLVFQGGFNTGTHDDRLLRGPGGAARARTWQSRSALDQPVVRHVDAAGSPAYTGLGTYTRCRRSTCWFAARSAATRARRWRPTRPFNARSQTVARPAVCRTTRPTSP